MHTLWMKELSLGRKCRPCGRVVGRLWLALLCHSPDAFRSGWLKLSWFTKIAIPVITNATVSIPGPIETGNYPGFGCLSWNGEMRVGRSSSCLCCTRSNDLPEMRWDELFFSLGLLGYAGSDHLVRNRKPSARSDGLPMMRWNELFVLGLWAKRDPTVFLWWDEPFLLGLMAICYIQQSSKDEMRWDELSFSLGLLVYARSHDLPMMRWDEPILLGLMDYTRWRLAQPRKESSSHSWHCRTSANGSSLKVSARVSRADWQWHDLLSGWSHREDVLGCV